MTNIEIMGILAPIFAGGVVIVTSLIVTSLDHKKAEAERKAKLASANDETVRMASAAE